MSGASSVGSILGVVLAGGQSRRMGTDKGLIRLAAKPLVVHAIDRLRPQVQSLVVNANHNASRYAEFGVAVVADCLDGFAGPLAGLLAGMRYAERHAPGFTHVATVAVDTPFFPLDCVALLASGLAQTPDARLAFAATDDGPQSVFALADISLAETLEGDIRSGAARRVVDWLRARPHAVVQFGDYGAFFNVNSPEELAQAEIIARASQSALSTTTFSN